MEPYFLVGFKPSITNSYRYSYHSGSTTGYVTGKSGDGIGSTGVAQEFVGGRCLEA